MKYTMTLAIAVGVGLYLVGAQTALAQPMRCSGEQKTCIATCMKITDAAAAKKCTASCHISQSFCMRTGCWDSGTSRYCGLTKQ